MGLKNMINDCIAELNGVIITSAVEILSPAPVAMYPYSSGYIMANIMPAMTNQKVILKHEVNAPKRSRIGATKSVISTISSAISKSIETTTLNASETTHHVTLESNSEEGNSEYNKINEEEIKR